ncbi:hypothetical protein Atai01_16860 [Amycolatopsis taiwanensis]|uniref:TerD domain-containing protein n=1 Tax=Amycolatopsis taiwanensis TaxID=342230 RepID=A0A9W6QZY5_9PSEU|nr:hypothetical protein Atai01_16860 [Amycolatopsis taiwanensis]
MIIRRTLRVPAIDGPPGDGAAVARQLDATLLGVGFTASRELMEHVSGLEPGVAMDLAVRVIAAVRELVGDHVRHNSYFIGFPDDVPDTVEFWVSCLRDALARAYGVKVAKRELRARLRTLPVNLLALPWYGRYRHTYAELLAAHDELIASAQDRITVLHLGGALEQEITSLYLRLAGSVTPLGEADLAILGELAVECLDGEQPESVPVRENRAVVNVARLAAGRPLAGLDTVTDVLRVACAASAGDVSLQAPTRFRSFRRRERRALLAALDRVVADNRGKLADVTPHARRWQRLGERLHPHEHGYFPHAREVFAVARGDRKARSLAGRVELAFASGDVRRAVKLLSAAPGLLLRQLDRVLRKASPDDFGEVLTALSGALDGVSGRVLCSVREHLVNRAEPDAVRVFVNRNRRAWTTDDRRPPLDGAVVARTAGVLDAELARRLPEPARLVVDPVVLALALPLSGKASEGGFAIMPRGSVTPVRGELLRFFTYWRQATRRTDYDLSALLLGDQFEYEGHVSWTNYHDGGAYYSGDITDAANGATEFIDVPLADMRARYVVPQVNIYSGEGFDEVAESMFGFMTRDRVRRGRPFEPRTVRMRSDMRGSGRVALPVVFARGEDGSWSAKWLHLYVRGASWGNRTEVNQVSTAMLVRAVMRREYLTVRYLVELLRRKAGSYTAYQPGMSLDQPVTFVGVERPDGLPDGSEAITLDRLNELVPE